MNTHGMAALIKREVPNPYIIAFPTCPLFLLKKITKINKINPIIINIQHMFAERKKVLGLEIAAIPKWIKIAVGIPKNRAFFLLSLTKALYKNIPKTTAEPIKLA